MPSDDEVPGRRREWRTPSARDTLWVFESDDHGLAPLGLTIVCADVGSDCERERRTRSHAVTQRVAVQPPSRENARDDDSPSASCERAFSNEKLFSGTSSIATTRKETTIQFPGYSARGGDGRQYSPIRKSRIDAFGEIVLGRRARTTRSDQIKLSGSPSEEGQPDTTPSLRGEIWGIVDAPPPPPALPPGQPALRPLLSSFASSSLSGSSRNQNKREEEAPPRGSGEGKKDRGGPPAGGSSKREVGEKKNPNPPRMGNPESKAGED